MPAQVRAVHRRIEDEQLHLGHSNINYNLGTENSSLNRQNNINEKRARTGRAGIRTAEHSTGRHNSVSETRDSENLKSRLQVQRQSRASQRCASGFLGAPRGAAAPPRKDTPMTTRLWPARRGNRAPAIGLQFSLSAMAGMRTVL